MKQLYVGIAYGYVQWLVTRWRRQVAFLGCLFFKVVVVIVYVKFRGGALSVVEVYKMSDSSNIRIWLNTVLYEPVFRVNSSGFMCFIHCVQYSL